MTQAQQAAVIWPLLVLAARMQRVLTYGEVEDCTGIVARSQGPPLYRIHRYCEEKGYPTLNSIVVAQETGFPGDNFPNGEMKELDFLIERARVYAYGWSVKAKPRSEEFEKYESQRPNV